MAGFKVAARALVEPKHLDREGCSECGIKRGLPHNKDCSHNNGKAVGVKELFEPRCEQCGQLINLEGNLAICGKCSEEKAHYRCYYCGDTKNVIVLGGPDMPCPYCGPVFR